MPWFWRMAGRPWMALAMGALLGIPASLYEARHLRQHFDQFVALRRLSPQERKAPQWRQLGLSAWAPTVVAMTVATGLGAVLGLSMVVAPLGALIPIPLTYPVERRIYQAARPTPQSG